MPKEKSLICTISILSSVFILLIVLHVYYGLDQSKGCSTEQIWMLIRHGSRNPSVEVTRGFITQLPEIRDQIIKSHKEGLGELSETAIASLAGWQIEETLVVEKEKWLVPAGEVELEEIGKRFKERFPELFHTAYENDRFKFKYTKTQRAEHSAKSFAKGIFGEIDSKNVRYPEALDEDPILRFYKGCPKWKQGIDKNPETYKEQKLFEQSKPFEDMLSRVRKRLAIKKHLIYEDIKLIFLACSFETSWHPERGSPWCKTLNVEDFKVLEYHQDLEYYWVDGYGHELTYTIACPTIKDVFFDHFSEKVTNPDNELDVISYFTHSGTLLKFIARLGLFRDSEDLRSDNFKTFGNKRKWRTSVIDRFATNIAFVLLNCNEVYNVVTLFQEKPIGLPACKGELMCPLKDIKTYFHNITRDCDVPKTCKLK